MPTPSELVTESFAQAQNFALTAQGQLAGYLASLASAVTVVPLVDVSFQPVASPGTSAAPTYTPAGAYTPPDPYASDLLTSLKTGLAARLTGGSGLPTAVETALWDRARERELATAQANVDRVMTENEALGWLLPAGVLVDSVAREQRAYFDKSAELSREIAIKQAELEQTNLQKAYEQGTALEVALIDAKIKLESLTVDATYKMSETALNAFRADVERYRAEIDQDVKFWETGIKQYEAQINYTLTAEKLNADIARANSNALQHAAEVGAQAYSQLTASAYSLIHASASVTAGANMAVNYSYSNDTVDQPTAITAV